MATRATADDVKDLLGRNYDFERKPALQPFIISASVVLTRVITCATNKGITLSEEELTEIEKWLAAHFYCVRDPLYTSKSTKGASGSFQTGQPMEGFGTTEYGRQAMALDYSSCLKNIGMKQRAGASWLGKNPSQQIPYTDRR